MAHRASGRNRRECAVEDGAALTTAVPRRGEDEEEQGRRQRDNRDGSPRPVPPADSLRLDDGVGERQQLRVLAQLVEDLAVTDGHGSIPLSVNSSRSASSARLKRILAAASVRPTSAPLSARVRPRRSLRTITWLWPPGSSPSASRSARATNGP